MVVLKCGYQPTTYTSTVLHSSCGTQRHSKIPSRHGVSWSWITYRDAYATAMAIYKYGSPLSWPGMSSFMIWRYSGAACDCTLFSRNGLLLVWCTRKARKPHQGKEGNVIALVGLSWRFCDCNPCWLDASMSIPLPSVLRVNLTLEHCLSVLHSCIWEVGVGEASESSKAKWIYDHDCNTGNCRIYL
jgi:hypothetical protein